MANRVVLTGRLAADPELRKTPQDISVTSFCIAVPKKFKKDGETGADFIDVVAWRQKAEFLCKYFVKGKLVEIDGSIQTRFYEDKEGKKRKVFEIVADEVNFVGNKADNEAPPTTSPPVSAINTPAGIDPFAAPVPVYASGGADDFEMAEDDGDLPF